MRDKTEGSDAIAVVMGDVDLVQALALAGIRSALFAEPYAPARLSRHVVERLRWRDNWREHEGVADVVLEYARRQHVPPVLFPQTDGDLVAISRHRAKLEGHALFLLADAQLIEDTVDKAGFARLAARLELPVPRSQELDPRAATPRDLDLRLPIVVKPLVRDADVWKQVEPSAKAVRVETADELDALWPRMAEAGIEVLAQEAIPGPETRMESYHAYVDAEGSLVAGFMGRKIRTLPARYGHSSALELTAAEDVERLGREVIERLGVRGVAKVDFKRDDDGRLWLLEINPRFTLWHHLAAVAGLNIPAIFFADRVGAPRPPVRPARPGARWVQPSYDVRAARAHGVGLGAWLRFARGCDAVSGAALRDPLPFLPGVL
ncbi:MAG TPA: ATP-grasp domain-containing protein, partial [Solirubrobacteraceae bacterium]